MKRRLSIADVARSLGISEDAARDNVKSGAIPGGVMLYRTEVARRERWVIDTTTFRAWLEAKGLQLELFTE